MTGDATKAGILSGLRSVPGLPPPPPAPGDVVRLKGGGPPLTVESVLADGSVAVAWFVDDTLCATCFHAAALERAEPGE